MSSWKNFFSKKEKSQPSIRVSSSIWVLGLMYLVCQIYIFIKGLVTHDIKESLVVPIIIATVILSICTVLVAILAYRSFRIGTKIEEEQLEEGRRLLREEEESRSSDTEQE